MISYRTPRDLLVYEGEVRSDSDGENTLLSTEDIIRFLCPNPEDSERLIEELAAGAIGSFSGIPIVEALEESFIDFDGEKLIGGPESYPAINEKDLIGFLSRLPGKEAVEFARYISDFNKRQELREAFIEIHKPEWERRGERYKKVRKALSLSLTGAAGMMGISHSTLGNFEKGQPLRNARMIENCYGTLLELSIMKRKVQDAEELLDMARYPEEDDFEEDFM